MELSKEYYDIVRFGLECACPDTDKCPHEHLNSVISKQTKFTKDDVQMIIFPIIDTFDFVVTSNSFLTTEGIEALKEFQEGRLPILKLRKYPKLTDERCRSNANTLYVEDGYETNLSGYLKFLNMLIYVNDFYCAYEGSGLHMWLTAFSIIKGERPAVYDILNPHVVFEESDRQELCDFINKYESKGQEKFIEWLEYIEELCPYEYHL